MITNNPRRSLEFAAYALALAKARGNLGSAVKMARELQDFSEVETVLKAAVAAGTTTSPEYSALTNYQTVAAGFVESLRATSILDAMLPFARRVPLRAGLSVVTAAANAGVVTDGGAKLVTKIGLSHGGLDPVRVATVTVVTEELLRVSPSAALQLIQSELVAGVSAVCNAVYLNELCAGISAHTSTGNVLADLRLLLAAVNACGSGKYFLVMTPETANQIATLPSTTGEQIPAFPTMTPTGGVIQGIAAMVSDQLPIDSAGQVDILLVEASQIAIAAEAPVLAASRDADLIMDEDPSPQDNVVSMFHTNSVAIRTERVVGFKRLRDSAVATLIDAAYGEQP